MENACFINLISDFSLANGLMLIIDLRQTYLDSLYLFDSSCCFITNNPFQVRDAVA